jgi:hypothetical protein
MAFKTQRKMGPSNAMPLTCEPKIVFKLLRSKTVEVLPVEERLSNWMTGDQSHHIRAILLGNACMMTTLVMVIVAIVDTTLVTIASASVRAEIKS